MTPKRLPNRLTTPVYLRVPDDIRARIEARVAETNESISDYVSRLVRVDTASPSSVAAQLPALLGHRCVTALESCISRIRAGDDCAPLLGELKDIRWDIVAVLEELRRSYDTTLDLANDPPWNGKH